MCDLSIQNKNSAVHPSLTFMFYFFELKEKDCIRRKTNSKQILLILEGSVVIILICRKFRLVGPVQQKLCCLCPKLHRFRLNG